MLVCECDKYDPNGSYYDDLDEFLDMVETVFGWEEVMILENNMYETEDGFWLGNDLVLSKRENSNGS